MTIRQKQGSLTLLGTINSAELQVVSYLVSALPYPRVKFFKCLIVLILFQNSKPSDLTYESLNNLAPTTSPSSYTQFWSHNFFAAT